MRLFKFVKKVFEESGKDRAGTLSAALAYVAIFSLGPLLLVLISAMGFFFGEDAAAGQLYGRLSDVVGPDTAKTIQDVIAGSYQNKGGVIALIIGVVGLLLAAIGLTSQLQNSFDAILRAEPEPGGGIKRMIYIKLKNISLLLFASLALAGSFVLSTVVVGVGRGAQSVLNLPPAVVELINTSASLLVFVFFMYLIYRVLPDVVIPKLVAFKTALYVSLLFVIGKIVLAFVIGNNGTVSSYGAAASLVTLLLWFYYSAQILLLGVEGIKVYGQEHVVVFESKRYTKKRRSINIDTKKSFSGRLAEAFALGFNKKSKK